MKAIERVIQYIDYKGINNSNFEKNNFLSNGYIATQQKRNADLGEGVLLKILDNCQDINPEWLLTGKGAMLRPQNAEYNQTQDFSHYSTAEPEEIYQTLKRCLEDKEKIIKLLEAEIARLSPKRSKE